MSVEVPPSEWINHWWPVYNHLIERVNVLATVDQALTVSSWYRNPAKNASVGGDPESQHLFGFAVDVATNKPEELRRVANSLGLVAVEEFDHVHLQLFPAGFLRSLGFFG